MGVCRRGGAAYNHLKGMFTVTNPAGNDHNNAKVLNALTHLRNFVQGFDFIRMHRDVGTVVAGVDLAPFFQEWLWGRASSAPLAQEMGERTLAAALANQCDVS